MAVIETDPLRRQQLESVNRIRTREAEPGVATASLSCLYFPRDTDRERKSARERKGKRNRKSSLQACQTVVIYNVIRQTVLHLTDLYVQRHHDLRWETNISGSRCIIVHINCIWSLAKQTLLNIILPTTCDKWKRKERSFSPPQTTSPRDTGGSGHE